MSPGKKRLGLAFAISLGVHGLLLLVLLRRQVPAVEVVSILDAPLDVDILPKPVEEPESPLRKTAEVLQSPRPTERTQATHSPQRKSNAQRQQTARSMPQLGANGYPTDAPLAKPTLPLPRSDLGSATIPEQTGRTLRNVPGEFPPDEVVAYGRQKEATDRIAQWGREAMGESRARIGTFDPYFHDLREAFQKRVEHAPNPDSSTAKNLAEAWRSGAARYGATGSAYGSEHISSAPHQTAWDERRTTALVTGDTNFIDYENKLLRGATLQEFADGKFGQGLIAILLLEHAFNGHLHSSVLLRSSGNQSFDEYVVGLAPTVASEVPVKSGETLRDGTKSVWEFNGRVTYNRKMSDIDLFEDWWYLLAMGGTGLLAGKLDPQLGSTYVDLRHPSFGCKVRLLKVY